MPPKKRKTRNDSWLSISPSELPETNELHTNQDALSAILREQERGPNSDIRSITKMIDALLRQIWHEVTPFLH